MPIASRRRSTSVSTRLMKKLATLATVDRSAPGVVGVRLEPVDVGLHHALVAVEAEDQRDVDVAALGDHLPDRRRRPRRWPGSSPSGCGRSICSCSSRAAASVPALSWARPGSTSTLTKPSPPWLSWYSVGEHVERAVDVGEHHRPVVVDDRSVGGGQRAELLVVVGRALDGLLEDRRVAGQAADARCRPGGAAAPDVM